MNSKPNIVFIFCDQWRADSLSCAGHPDVKTPHLDSLAAEGVRFSNVTTQSPVCVPARASLFTGRYVHQHRCLNNGLHLWPETPNMVRAIREAGYQTANRGKLHLFWRHDNELLMSNDMLKTFGFDDPMETTGKCSQGNLRGSAYSEHLRNKDLLQPFWRDLRDRVRARKHGVTFGPSILTEEDHIDGWIMDRGRDFVQKHTRNQDGQPFFLWLGPPGPHDPFDPPAPWDRMYDASRLGTGIRRLSEDPVARAMASKINLVNEPDETIQEMRANYYGNCSFIDNKIGQLVQDLKANGTYDSTWIVFASDHGEMLGDFHLTGKGIFHQASDQIPLIIKPPKSFKKALRGEVSNALVELIDVGTTLREIAGGDLPGDQGISLLPLLNGSGKPDTHRSVVLSQIGNLIMVKNLHTKLVFQGNDEPKLVAFYDLKTDPDEFHNLLPKGSGNAKQFYEETAKPAINESCDQLEAPWIDERPFAAWSRNPLLECLDS